MHKPLLSIIIPHYNIPDLLMRCLASIPVDERVQVIVVDDCSPDAETYKESYPELSRPYLELYSTIEGGSAGRARNVGMRYAKGKWLLFVDADDFLSDGLIGLIEEYGNCEEDILFFGFRKVMSDDITVQSVRDSSLSDIFVHCRRENDDVLLRYSFPSLWNKWVKAELVEKHGIRFDETRWSNDVMFSMKIGLHAGKTRIINKTLYVLTERVGSLTYSYIDNSITWQEYKVRSDIKNRRLDFIIRHGLPVECQDNRYKLQMIKSHFSFLIRYESALFFRHPTRVLSFIGFVITNKFTYLRNKYLCPLFARHQ